MKLFFAILLVIYIFGVIFTFFCGLGTMLLNAEYGRDDIDYKEGKMLCKYSIVFPYAACKLIQSRLDDIEL